MLAGSSSSEPGDVAVSHASITEVWRDPARLVAAQRWLTPSERARYARYRHDRDRQMFLLGRVMARATVGRALGVEPTAWRWREGERGRPEIDDAAAPVSFNLAHSGDVVVCAVSRGCVVGVDVEDKVRPPVDAAIVKRFCAPSEVTDIEAQQDGWRDRFLLYWTLKEAYLKARGLGIAVHLSHVCFHLAPDGITIEFLDHLAGTNTHWAFELAEIGRHHVLAVAAPIMNGVRPRFTIAPFPVALLP